MKRKEPKPIPVTVSSKLMPELKFMPVTVSSKLMPDLKFMPPVTLSYESTLELTPIPVTLGTAKAGGAGKGTVRGMTKAVRTDRPKRAAAASARVRSAKTRTKKAKAERKKGA